MTKAYVCRHLVFEELCIVEECRARGLVGLLRELVDVGSPHENASCPEDDTCECRLAHRINAVMAQDTARKNYQASRLPKKGSSYMREEEAKGAL